MRDSNGGSRPDGVAMGRRDRFIASCDGEDMLRDVCGTSLGDDVARDSGWRAGGPNADDPNGNQRDIRDNLNVLGSRSLDPGGTSQRDASAKQRKSVSFEDDVIVYLFDQESPTSELHWDARSSPPEGLFEDTGLQWEDDFSALETQRASTPPTPRGAALPGRFSLSQTCLFLTHVSESDLEL